VPTSLDDLVSMAIFARVVEARSFTAAASVLEVSKSAVSKRVAALERRLGSRLLQRTTRRLALTPDGARLYERCLQMLRAADEASQLGEAARGEPQGVLRVNCPMSFSDLYLGQAAADFVTRHPLVRVELSVANAMVDLILERVDVAIRITPALTTSSLVARRLATTPKVVCAAPDYLRRCGTPRTADDLRTHACLRFSQLPVEVEWRFRRGTRPLVVPVSGPIVADNSEALRRAAIAGAGIIVLPLYYAAADLEAGRLQQVRAGDELEPLGVFAVYSKGPVVPRKVRAFVDFLVARFRTFP
jgi:DNA-binding transcriptional LysR family regulator